MLCKRKQHQRILASKARNHAVKRSLSLLHVVCCALKKQLKLRCFCCTHKSYLTNCFYSFEQSHLCIGNNLSHVPDQQPNVHIIFEPPLYHSTNEQRHWWWQFSARDLFLLNLSLLHARLNNTLQEATMARLTSQMLWLLPTVSEFWNLHILSTNMESVSVYVV